MQISTQNLSEVIYFHRKKPIQKNMFSFSTFFCLVRKKCFDGLLYIMDGDREENSRRPCVFMFSVILINFNGKTSMFIIV